MLLRQHGGDPCAFRFGVDAGFRSAHARPFSQDFQRFRIVVRAGHVVAVQHGVVVEPLVRHESGDAGRRHRVRHVAERLRRFAGARTVQEQACGTICRRVERLANDGIHGFAAVQRDRDMRFLGAVRALLRGFEHGTCGRVNGLVVVSVIWSVNGSTCHFGAIALPSAHRTMVRRSASAVVAAQVTRIRFTMLRTVRHSSRIRRTWRGKHGIMGNPRNDRNSCAASQCSRAVKQYEIRGKSQ